MNRIRMNAQKIWRDLQVSKSAAGKLLLLISPRPSQARYPPIRSLGGVEKESGCVVESSARCCSS